MLHAKYQMSAPYCLREEDFQRFSCEKVTKLHCGGICDLGGHNLNKLGRDQLGDVTCQISNVYALRFQRRKCLNKLLLTPHARTTRRRTNWYHKSSPWKVPGELKDRSVGLWFLTSLVIYMSKELSQHSSVQT